MITAMSQVDWPRSATVTSAHKSVTTHRLYGYGNMSDVIVPTSIAANNLPADTTELFFADERETHMRPHPRQPTWCSPSADAIMPRQGVPVRGRHAAAGTDFLKCRECADNMSGLLICALQVDLNRLPMTP